jgi:nitroimidazol reductase NimA-like FMN-containing flavoprotein (pyridoxamine 5'-phosphate oxidase superfamily)
MRRKDRELTDLADFLSVLEKADVCHLAMSDHDVPYLVTMNFGLKHDKNLVLYFHCAHEGKKIDFLKKNNRVCFGADIEHEFFMAEKGTSCGCSMRFRSVVGMGRISFITERTEKYEALKAIMRHYTEATAPVFDEKMVDRTTILRLDVEQIAGKRRP